MIGKNHKGALVIIVDRKSKSTLIKKVDSKHAEGVTIATVEFLKPYADTHTITIDNGKEFAGHETIAEALETEIYFTHLYCSWERGLNENTNGLIRQYFPKGSSFDDIQVVFVMHRLNNRPRKRVKLSNPSIGVF